MAEDAVEQAVQVGAGQIPAVFAVGVQQPCGGVVQPPAVRGKAAAALLRGRGQRTQRRSQVALVQIQLTAQLFHHPPCHGLLPLGLGLDMLGH